MYKFMVRIKVTIPYYYQWTRNLWRDAILVKGKTTTVFFLFCRNKSVYKEEILCPKTLMIMEHAFLFRSQIFPF